MKKILLIVSITSLTSVTGIYSTHSKAASAPQGNPIDTIPQINTDIKPPTKVNVQPKETQINRPSQSTLRIREFKIQGVKSIGFKSVADIFQPITNKEITVNDLVLASQEVTKLYQAAGYPLSFGYIPQQNFQGGIAHVVIVEGFVKDIKISGKTNNNEKRIQKILQPLLVEKPLTQKTFERISNILTLQPGLKVTLNIPPPQTTDGGSTLTADISQKKVDLSTALQLDSDEARAVIGVTVNSLTPLGDQLTLATLQPRGTDKTEYYSLGYNVPLGSQGTVGKINATSYKEKPTLSDLEALGYRDRYSNETKRLTFSAAHPLRLSNTENWSVGGGFYLNSERQTYTPQLNQFFPDLGIKTDLRVLYLETSYARATDIGISQVSASLYKGVNSFGARTKNNTNDTDFTKLRLLASQSFKVKKDWEVKLSGAYQYSGDTLANSEQISFGDKFFGMGYQAGEIAGDKGWGIASELNYSFRPDAKYVKLVQPYVGLDTSKISFNKFSVKHDKLSSATIGVRLNNKTYYSLDMAVSQPIGDKPINDNKPRYSLLYTYQF